MIMKRALISLLVFLCSIAANGQQLTKQDYLRKSKNQKTMAWILTAGGSALVLGGVISYASESSSSFFPGKTVGTVLMACGVPAVAGGVVLFSASKRNERKANEMSMAFHLQLQSVNTYQYQHLTKTYYPALSLHIGFNKKSNGQRVLQ